MFGNVVFNNSPDSFKIMLANQNRFSYPTPIQGYLILGQYKNRNHNLINPVSGSTLKDAALRSLHRKADVGIRGSAPHSRLAADSPLSSMSSVNTQIRMKGKNNTYEVYKGPTYSSVMQKTPSQQMRRTQLRDSNDRLKALQELDKRREEQIKKEFEALELRRKQQEEDTQRRINIKKVRLAETGYLAGAPSGSHFMAPLTHTTMKDRLDRDSNQQNRFVALVFFLVSLIIKIE